MWYILSHRANTARRGLGIMAQYEASKSIFVNSIIFHHSDKIVRPIHSVYIQAGLSDLSLHSIFETVIIIIVIILSSPFSCNFHEFVQYIFCFSKNVITMLP